jgi:hypothetical protein
MQRVTAHTESISSELEAARTAVHELNERVMIAEGETRQLRSMLEHERSNTEELVLMARQNGELDCLRHRMQEQSATHGRSLTDAQQRIAELEEEVRKGDECRRKLHNTVQVSRFFLLLQEPFKYCICVFIIINETITFF